MEAYRYDIQKLICLFFGRKNKKKTYHLLIMLHTGGAQILMSTNTVIALAIPVKTSGIIPWISSGRNWNFSLIPLVFKLNTSGIPPLFQWNFRSTCKIFHWYMNGNSTFPTVILMEYQRYSSGISKVHVRTCKIFSMYQ